MNKDNDGIRPQDLIGDPEHPNTPAQMLQALIGKAIDTGSLKPLGQALGGVQAQVDSVFGMFQSYMQEYGKLLAEHSHAIRLSVMQLDTLRMAFVGLIDLLVEKNVFSKDEWDKVYEEKVQKKIEERIEAARKNHEEAIKAEQGKHECEGCQEESSGPCSCHSESEQQNKVMLASEQEGAVQHFSEPTKE